RSALCAGPGGRATADGEDRRAVRRFALDKYAQCCGVCLPVFNQEGSASCSSSSGPRAPVLSEAEGYRPLMSAGQRPAVRTCMPAANACTASNARVSAQQGAQKLPPKASVTGGNGGKAETSMQPSQCQHCQHEQNPSGMRFMHTQRRGV